MIPLSLREVADAVGGRLAAAGDAAVTSVVVDSREVRAGSLFVAVAGEHADGHDFARAAVAAGAVGVLAAREVGVPAVVVDDVTVALGRLAHAVWAGASLRHTVAITGSSGKTTTKDMVAQVFERVGPTVAPAGSYNNEIGLPLTVCRIEPDTEFLVLEMSARGLGHIRALCDVVRPDAAVVLNVGSAHLGEFGSRETIATAKREIVEALRPDGVQVLNADDPLVLAMQPHCAGRCVTFGESPGADVRAVDVRLDSGGRPAFRLVTPAGEAEVRLRFVGEHQVANALAAAAVGQTWLPLPDLAAALSEAVPRSHWRMESHQLAGGATLLNDAYNANPESTRAALKTLAAVGRGRRTWAVLGEMAELGETAWAEHDAIGRLCVRLDVSRLVVVGDAAKGIHAGASLEGSWAGESVFVPDVDAAADLLRREVRAGDVVLVKASRAAGLERVALALSGEATT